MGNKQLVEEAIHYQQMGPAKNARYGEALVFQHKDNQSLVCVKYLKNANAKVSQLNQAILKKYQELKNKNLVKLLAYKQEDSKPLCGLALFQTVAYLEYLPQSLENDIDLRTKQSNFYKEAHLWFILYNVINAGQYMNSQGSLLGDIGLSQILINQKVNVKLIPSGIFQSDLNAIQRYEFDELKYIDPALFSQLEAQKMPDLEELQKNDVFALGVTMLELMNLKQYPGNYKMEQSIIRSVLQQLASRYSKQLLNFVATMLLDSASRPTFQQLFDVLKPYESEILGMKKFTIDKNKAQQALAKKQDEDNKKKQDDEDKKKKDEDEKDENKDNKKDDDKEKDGKKDAPLLDQPQQQANPQDTLNRNLSQPDLNRSFAPSLHQSQRPSQMTLARPNLNQFPQRQFQPIMPKQPMPMQPNKPVRAQTLNQSVIPQRMQQYPMMEQSINQSINYGSVNPFLIQSQNLQRNASQEPLLLGGQNIKVNRRQIGQDEFEQRYNKMMQS